MKRVLALMAAAIMCFALAACTTPAPTTPECEHIYDNACDATCNKCAEMRIVPDHVYDNDNDYECNECGYSRAPQGNACVHAYDNACDNSCNKCGEIRTVPAHVYDDDNDTTCNECGFTREINGEPCVHAYDNACDNSCNKCGELRTVPAHVYDGDNDATCNECGFTREIVLVPEGYAPISTEAQLKAIANNRNGKYILTNDITLTSDWTSICNGDKPFNGILDGDGYSIIGMNVKSGLIADDAESPDYLVAMFGELKGTIKNITFKKFKITVTKADITATTYATMKADTTLGITNLDIHAGLVGYNKGTLSNVKMDVVIDIQPKTDTVRVRAGALAGKSTSLIENCVSTGSIKTVCTDGYARVGGIVGYMSGDSITKGSESAVGINAENSLGKLNLGGIVGNIEKGTVENCFSKSQIIAKNVEKGTVAGGLIGLIDNTSAKYTDMNVTVSDSYAIGNISATSVKGSTAGLIGELTATLANTSVITIENCAAKGNASGGSRQGGFMAKADFFDTNGAEITSITMTQYASYWKMSNNKCVYADKYAQVGSPASIVIPSHFTLA